MFINGTYRILYLDYGEGFKPVGCLTSHTFNEESEVIDTTTRDNAGWKTSKATNQSYSISFSGLVLEDRTDFNRQTYYDLRQIKRDRLVVDWRIDAYDYGKGIITTLSDTNEIDENVSFEAELIGYGKPYITFDNIYDLYVINSEADAGIPTDNECLRDYIDTITQ